MQLRRWYGLTQPVFQAAAAALNQNFGGIAVQAADLPSEDTVQAVLRSALDIELVYRADLQQVHFKITERSYLSASLPALFRKILDIPYKQ